MNNDELTSEDIQAAERNVQRGNTFQPQFVGRLLRELRRLQQPGKEEGTERKIRLTLQGHKIDIAVSAIKRVYAHSDCSVRVELHSGGFLADVGESVSEIEALIAAENHKTTNCRDALKAIVDYDETIKHLIYEYTGLYEAAVKALASPDAGNGAAADSLTLEVAATEIEARIHQPREYLLPLPTGQVNCWQNGMKTAARIVRELSKDK